MRITNLKGGLGNQMFQYARARATATDETVRLNVYELEHPAAGDTPRLFALEDFNLGPTEIIRVQPTLLSKVTDRLRRIIQPDWGYFQSEDYFISEEQCIRHEFSLRSPLMGDAEIFSKRIKDSEASVSIHVRRGDYIKNPTVLRNFGICSLTYYEKAITHMRSHISHPTFFIFSDDISWARENLPLHENAVFVQGTGLTDKAELSLMSLCPHNIIANSSFSWWGAWLNPNPSKIVIAPTPWFNRASYNKRIIPRSWIQLPK